MLMKLPNVCHEPTTCTQSNVNPAYTSRQYIGTHLVDISAEYVGKYWLNYAAFLTGNVTYQHSTTHNSFLCASLWPSMHEGGSYGRTYLFDFISILTGTRFRLRLETNVFEWSNVHRLRSTLPIVTFHISCPTIRIFMFGSLLLVEFDVVVIFLAVPLLLVSFNRISVGFIIIFVRRQFIALHCISIRTCCRIKKLQIYVLKNSMRSTHNGEKIYSVRRTYTIFFGCGELACIHFVGCCCCCWFR